MKKKFGQSDSLYEVGRISKNSSTVKTAVAYKKKLTENAAKKKRMKIVAVNVACIIVASFVSVIMMSANSSKDPDSAPVYYVVEKDQEGSHNTKAGSVVKAGANNGKEETLDALEVMNDAMESIIISQEMGNLGSDEIKPQSQSDFLPILQLRLMDLRFLDKDEPSTYYGAATEAAVKEFQSQNNLPNDGIASYQTLLLLFSDKANNKVIGKWQEGQHIVNIQERLNQLGYSTQVDGVYGEQTEQAAMAFQMRHGIEQTGKLDETTENLLFSDEVICADGSQFVDTRANKKQKLNSEAMVEIAYAQLGSKYVPGGRAPGGFDCSGLVYYCLNASGYDISFLSSNGWRNSRYEYIEKMEDLQPGDICTFDGHVGIYIGYNKMIDASSSDGIVRISSDITKNKYWSSYWEGARRLS